MALNLQTLTDSSTSAGILTDLAKSASNLDLVASLENRVSGGANATQTTASKQPRAHVPLGDGHLYLSGVSGNGAQITSDSTTNITGDIDIRAKLTLPDANWIPSSNSIVVARDQVIGSLRTYSFSIRHSSGYLDFTFYNASGGLVANINSGARPQFSAGETGYVRVTREASSGNVKYWKSDDGTSWTQVGFTRSTPAGGMRDQSSVNLTMGFRADGNNLRGAFHEVQIYSSIDETSKVLDIDFSDGDHKASSFTCSTGQTVTINTSGTDPATIVRKSFMRMDLVDDEYEFTTDSAVNGTIVVATLEGTYSANISLDASTTYDLQARGVASSANVGFLKNPVGYLVSSSPLSDSEITSMENYFVDKGAAARSAFGSVTNFSNAWYNSVSLTSFPLIDTSSATNILGAWRSCSSLTSFPLINTSLVTNFINAWRDCASLTSFPLIDTSSGTSFNQTWRNCSDLTTFPANFFDSWSPASVSSAVLNQTWDGCTSLTAQSVENILTSLDTSGVYGTNTGLSGGTQLSDNTIDIDYDGTTLSSATSTAITSLKSKNWAISINSVIQ